MFYRLFVTNEVASVLRHTAVEEHCIRIPLKKIAENNMIDSFLRFLGKKDHPWFTLAILIGRISQVK